MASGLVGLIYKLQKSIDMDREDTIRELKEILKIYHHKSDTEHMSKDVVTSLENLIRDLEE